MSKKDCPKSKILRKLNICMMIKKIHELCYAIKNKTILF